MPFKKGYASKKSAGEARKAGKPKRKDEERRKSSKAKKAKSPVPTSNKWQTTARSLRTCYSRTGSMSALSGYTGRHLIMSPAWCTIVTR